MKPGRTHNLTCARLWLRRLVAAAPIALTPALAPVAQAQAQEQTYAFEIQSQPLSSALLSLGRQADLSVLAQTSLVEGKVAPQVKGQFSPAGALDRLLDGSGLTYTFVQTNAVRIIAKDNAQSDPRRTSTDVVPGRDPDTRIVVTGTTIEGVAPEASPFYVYTSEDIARSGAVTVEQFIGKMPQNLGTVSQYAAGANGAGPNLDAVTAVDLRGLGLGTTLTLVNGRRMALSNAGRSADVSFIPAGAIARVEVLTDGASAIYGSDAIGGVVNFLLRDDFEGAESRLSYGGVSRGGLRQGDASQTVGGRWDAGHALASYSFHAASALKTSDRDYAAPAGPGNLTPVDTRHSAFATLTQDLGNRVTLGLDLGGGWRKVKNGYSNLTSAVPASQTFTRYQSTAGQAFGTIDLGYDLTDDFKASVTASYARVDTDGVATVVRFNTVPQQSTSGDFSARNSQLDIAAKLAGSLMSLPGGDLRFSIGGGVLEERYRGVNPLSNQQTTGELGRRSPYAFAEIFAPLVGPRQNLPFLDRLSVSLAARYTDYQDASAPSLDMDFGDSIDPKVGVLWSPFASLNLRGTFGSSFRAPSLTQLDPAGGLHYLFPITVGGAPSIILGLAGYPTNDLGPETADTYTLGIDYQNPNAPGFRISATYYNIDYTGRIDVAPTGGLNPYDTPQLLPDLIYRPTSAAFIEEALRATPLLVNATSVDLSDPQAGAAALFARNDVWVFDNRFKNLALSQQEGVDLSVSHRMATSLGDLELAANATHILRYKQQGASTASVLDAKDIPGGPPDWRARFSAGLSRDALGATLSVNFTDDYKNRIAPPGQQTIASWTTIDLNMTYDLKQTGSAAGTHLSLSVQNLLDEDPPFLRRGSGSNIIYPIGFDPANANPLGRFLAIGLTHTW